MLPDGRRLGAHLPLGGGMVKAVERAHEIGASALQVFADNPTAWRRRSVPPRGLPEFRRRLVDLDIRPLAIHAAYLVNLAGPEKDFFERSVAVLGQEMIAGHEYGARFVNVHAGSHMGSGIEAGTKRIAEGVELVLGEIDATPDTPRLVIENSAGGGFGIGATVEELANIGEAIEARGANAARVAFCLDTAHLWGAGYEISSPEVVGSVIEAFDRLIGLDRLVMVHLNDTKSDLASRSDRHEHLGAGRIGPAGLRAVLCHPSLAHVAYYLETPGMEEGYDAINMARALDLVAGRPLPELPPEAFELRRDRKRAAPARTGGRPVPPAPRKRRTTVQKRDVCRK